MSEAEKITPRPATESRSMPLFYKRPEALHPDRHGALRITPVSDYHFANSTHAIPLNAVEFGLAGRHYPIVFAIGSQLPAAIAVVGLRRGQNLFVDASGRWAEGVYIPSYVRRYPFVLARNGEDDAFTLCIDMESDRLHPDGGMRLFDGQQPGEAVRKMLDFCKAFQTEAGASEKALAVIAKHGLLIAKEARFALPGGEVLLVNDFSIVDEARFAALSDKAFLDLRRSGALPVVYAHLWSMRNWTDLTRRAAKT